MLPVILIQKNKRSKEAENNGDLFSLQARLKETENNGDLFALQTNRQIRNKSLTYSFYFKGFVTAMLYCFESLQAYCHTISLVLMPKIY